MIQLIMLTVPSNALIESIQSSQLPPHVFYHDVQHKYSCLYILLETEHDDVKMSDEV